MANTSKPIRLKQVRQNRRRAPTTRKIPPQTTLRESKKQSSRPSPGRFFIFSQTIAAWSQVGVLFVIAIGYFYTVVPVFQKEKLAEEVAVLQSEIDDRNEELANAREELAPLQGERNKLAADLRVLQSELAHTRQNLDRTEALKNEIERRISFMTYTHYLPDGTPATSQEQVEEVAEIRKQKSREFQKRTYFMMLELAYQPWSEDSKQSGEAFSSVAIDVDLGTDTFPFTENEQALTTQEDGVKSFIRQKALEVLERYHKDYIALDSRDEKELAEIWKKEAQNAIEQSRIDWEPAIDVATLGVSFQAKQAQIEKNRADELARVEEEYGGWEKTWNRHKREILRHNYEVGKSNADVRANAELHNLRFEYRNTAREVRSAIRAAIGDLLEVAAEAPGTR